MGLEDIKEQFELIKLLSNKKYRKPIIAHADKKLVKAICEIIYNVLKNNINLSPTYKSKLQKYKKALRCMCEKSSLKNKKTILKQRGGFLQFLIPAVVGGLSEIISAAISRNV